MTEKEANAKGSAAILAAAALLILLAAGTVSAGGAVAPAFSVAPVDYSASAAQAKNFGGTVAYTANAPSCCPNNDKPAGWSPC